MENDRFSSMLFLLVPQIVQHIKDTCQIDEEKATEMLFRSELYSKLEDESTKLWHLSARALFEMFCEEHETGTITYPEEA